MDELVSKTIITTASTLLAEPIKHVLNTWLKPKLETIKKKGELNEKLESFVFDVFHSYLANSYEEHQSVNIIALGQQQIKLEQIYIPVTIYSEEKRERIIVDGYNSTFVEKYRKIVVEDSAGMGKSTLMKKMFISSIEQNVGIPIFIELKELHENPDVVSLIFKKINQLKDEHNKEFIVEIINRGDFIFFLDGYDEIPFLHKQYVTKSLKQFIGHASNNTFILTSRPDDSLTSFGQFQKFEILDLTKDEAFKLFEKFDAITQLDLSKDVSKHIEEHLENNQFDDLESFLGNPLLASFLYLTFKHQKDLPTVKIEFYEKVYDALFELHDLSKDSLKRDKYSGLTKRNMEKVLMKLGFICVQENNNDYDKNKVLKLISEAKSSQYFKEIDEENILKDLTETVPLFSKIGLKYKWAHKSFMDYFGAIAIYNHEKREEILTSIFCSTNLPIYLNMLDFYYETDRQLFDKVFVYPIIKQFINYIDASGVNPHEDVTLLSYLEIIYNRMFIFDCSEEILNLKENERANRFDFEKAEKIIRKRYSIKYPEIGKYHKKVPLRTVASFRYF